MCRPCQYRYNCPCRGLPGEAGYKRCVHYGRLNRMRAAGLRANEYMYLIEQQLCRNDSEPELVPVERKCSTCSAADARAERLQKERIRWDSVKSRVAKAARALRGMADLFRLRNMEWEDPAGQAKKRSARKMAFSAPSTQEPGPLFVTIQRNWVELVSTRVIIDRYGDCSGLTERIIHEVIAEINDYFLSRSDYHEWLRRA